MKRLLTLATFCVTILTLGYTNVKVYAAPYEQNITGINTILDKVNPIEIQKAIETEYRYTTNRINLRKEASTNSDIITKIDKREKVVVTEPKKTSSNGWIKVKYKDYEGYVKSEYLRDTELPSLEFTDEEIELMAKILWLESRGESDEGTVACGIVILNRIIHIAFSDNLLSVLSDEGEFSTWKLIGTAKPTEREFEIIEEVLRGEYDGLLTKDYVYFSTTPRNDKETIKIGGHYYCKY